MIIRKILVVVALVSAVLGVMQVRDSVYAGDGELAGKIIGEVNVYSSRKEKLVKLLFQQFTEKTGIKVNFITDKPAALIARMQSEGKNSPADVFLTADVANIEYAGDKGLLAPITSEVLNDNIMAEYRDPQGYWYGLTLRARVIIYAKDRVSPEDISTYEGLADEKWRNRVLIRSSSNVYNQSLVASMLRANGVKETEDWLRGLVANFARKPQGGDTDQIRAVASGEGDIAVANSYYFGRLLVSKKESDQAVASKVGLIFPNQGDRGAHVNISGGGVAVNAKNKDNAISLLEFLSSAEAQKIYSEVNHEFPVSNSVPKSDIVKGWGEFKADSAKLSDLHDYHNQAVKLMDKAGWR